MNNNGKKLRPTTVASIVIFALDLTALVIGIILQLSGAYNAAKAMLIGVTPAMFVAAVIVALVDTHLNPNVSIEDKERATRGVFGMFGCGALMLIAAIILPIILLVGLWLLLFVGYASAL